MMLATTTTTTTTMTTTSSSSSDTMSQRRQQPKRPQVPFLLESFPSPPSFIPSSPIASSNPPPSLPPSLPLPPVPGPSPISQEETLLFLSSSRASKLSITSTRSSSPPPSNSDSRRNSTATLVSLRSVAPTSRQTPTAREKRESIASLRSIRSNYPFPTLPHSPNVAVFPDSRPYVISEEDATDVVALSHFGGISPLPLTDIDDDDIEKVLDLVPSPTLPSTTSSRPNESISSIDMRDLPTLQDDDTAVGQPPKSSSARRPWIEIPPLSSPPPQLEGTARSPSPDIVDILIATTSRPRTSSTRSRSRSRPRKLSGVRQSSSEVFLSASRRTSNASDALLRPSPDGTPVDQDWRDDSFVSDYGVPLHRETGGGYGLDYIDPDTEARLERQLEGGESDSDSSLDLHTPLPTLMLRHGHLSPHSKLLPQRTEQSLSDPSRGSIFSVASAISKSGTLKDDRDTPKRRDRHRDQRLLRGGIGLTTGLGWSDSEDEDAPSALTRRISSLNLARQASMSSLPSTTRPMRSLSGSTWGEDDVDLDRSTSRSTRTLKGRSSLPPTSWQKRSVASRMSSSSTSSMFSLSLNIPEQIPVSSRGRFRTEPSLRVKDVPEMSRASSTASSVSIQLPITPGDNEDVQSPKLPDIGKTLPPLPGTSISSKLAGAQTRAFVTRSRAYSSSSSVSSSMGRDPSIASVIPPPQALSTSSTTTTRTIGSPRPLQLTTSKSLTHEAKEEPRLTTAPKFSRSSSDQQRLRALAGPRYSDSSLQPPSMSASRSTSVAVGATSNTGPSARALAPSTAAPVATAVAPAKAGGEDPPTKPKPRIGTGMPYRTASHSSLGTQMKMPRAGYGGGNSGVPRIPVAAPRGVAF